ncbi:MAG: response regulator [Mesorhizobium amorphae]|nr:MAG: response regulator [Mesorhizobium amorphae]
MTGRVLYVDGSDVVRKVALRILQSEGFSVDGARDGYEALGRCATEMPDLIVVDGTLSDMLAPELIRHIRAMPNGTHPRIMVSMVELDVGAVMRAKRAGAQGYMLKPFDRLMLMKRIGALMHSAASRAAA